MRGAGVPLHLLHLNIWQRKPAAWHNGRQHPISSPLTSSPAGCRGGALVGMDLGFMGPNYSISTACATANYCFVAAQHHLRSGQADIMLVGGSEAPIIPVGLGGFVACR